MFEFDKFEPGANWSPSVPNAPYAPFDGARRRSFLVWSEHCTECAAPDCYASCSLYRARPDGRCRRFDFGMYPNRYFPTAAGHGAEVVFRRWGKIEAKGNARLYPSWMVKAAERVAGGASPLLNGLGKAVARATGDKRWGWLSFSLLDRLAQRLGRPGAAVPDAFVVEIYNPGDEPATLLLSMAVDRTRLTEPLRPDQLPRPLLRRMTIPPGHVRLDVPRAEFAPLLASGLPFGIALTPEAAEGTHLVFLTLDFVSLPEAPQAARPAAKCVIFDLDNTLWDGVLLEGDVVLRGSVRALFETLDARGILLSAVSKNAPDDAMAKLRAFGLDEYLLHPQIGWGPKSDGVRRIAQSLDIGTDTFLFVDDNPFERAEVERAVPGVETLPDTALATLADHPRLQGAVTEESRRRRLMYREAGARQAAAAAYGSDYVDFLRSCEIGVEIRPPAPADRQRIAELVQRTNQLNFSGRKYPEEEVAAILADPSREKYVVACRDRFGDYGIVGFCLARVERDRVLVEDLMLSCRVQGKFIEQALFDHLARRPGWSAASIEVNFHATARNGAARAVLESLGFEEATGEALLRRSLDGEGLATDLIAVDGRYEPRLSPAA